jgi:small conductance mechanosensitive channel
MEIFSSMEGIKLGSLSVSSILSAIVVFVICLIVIKIISALIKKALERSKMEKGLKSFITSAVKIALWAVAIVIVAGNLGIDTASLVAVLSVAGLALSLAIQGIAANLFSGVTILATKPFVSGNYVALGGIEGTVESIGLFHTTVRTIDNKLIYVPNSEVTSSKVTNYTHEPTRRVDIPFGVDYSCPVEDVKAAVLELMREHPLVLDEPEPFVSVLSYKGSNIEYVLRGWCKTEDYWTVFFAMNEGLLPALQKHGCAMSYEHVNVHMIEK